MAEITWTNEKRKLSDLIPWPKNPRQIKEPEAKRLVGSKNKFAQPWPIIIGPNNELYDGHQRLNVWGKQWGGDLVVDVRVCSRELSEKEREELVILAHKGTNAGWDFDMLANQFEIPDLIEWGFDEKELGFGEEEEPTEQGEEETDLDVLRVPDAIWGTDNDYGIPLLDSNMQAKCLEAPFAGWGTMPRKDKMKGTYHFYVEDYRFEALWKDPLDVANSACSAIVEPNFSVYDDMPRAVAIWQMYRKRWLARWYQSVGIAVFVDLNISERHADLRLMGVPAGWKAYATRAYSERLDATVREYEAAVEQAGTDSILFVVYGGGKKAEELSKQRGWIWYPDQQTKDAGGMRNG